MPEGVDVETIFVVCFALIVIGIVFAIGVKPGLYPFGPVLFFVRGSIGVFPQATLDGLIEGVFQLLVEVRMGRRKSHFMNRMSEFMDQDVFCGIWITGKFQKILFPAAHRWSAGSRTESTCPSVPVLLWLEITVFRYIGSSFTVGHDRKPDIVVCHGLKDVRSMANHLVNQPACLTQGGVAYGSGTDNRKSIQLGPFLIEVCQSKLLAYCFRWSRDRSEVWLPVAWHNYAREK